MTGEHKRLIQDYDGHWYVILVVDVEAFEKWIDDPYGDGGTGKDFSNNRVDGPHTVVFREFEERDPK